MRKGSGGRIPDNGTIFKVGTNEGYIEPDKDRRGGMRIEVTKNEAENFTGFGTNSRNVGVPEKGGCKQDAERAEGGYTFNGRMGDRKKGERITVGGRFAGKENVLRFGGNAMEEAVDASRKRCLCLAT